MTHKFVVDEAMELVCGPRMQFYGSPDENFQDIADTWTPYVRRVIELKGRLDPIDVAALMILLKCVRQTLGYHRDSTVDIAGYAQLMEVLSEPEALRAFVLRATEKIKEQRARDQTRVFERSKEDD